MKQLSRAVIFVHTNPKEERIAVLKSPDVIEQLDEEDINVLRNSLVDRYMHRPQQLRNMCLAEFAATYCTAYYAKNDEINNITLPDTEDQSTTEKDYP